jgi:hypothetical protein
MKIAIVVQRYGLEVNGGAELHSRILAEKLSIKYEVSVLTTKSLDYVTWENFYENNDEDINGVKVLRFKSDSTRNFDKIDKSRDRILKIRKYQKMLNKFYLIRELDNRYDILSSNKSKNDKWLEYQGPFTPDLIQYIEQNEKLYDCFIFFTYLYYPTAKGMPLVGNKSIFIPTAHDEPELYASLYKNVFKSAKFIMYNTQEEKKLVEQNFPKITSNNDIAGLGFDKTEIPLGYKLPCDFDYNFDFIVYIGRIDHGKECDVLYHNFLDFKIKFPESNIKLVFIGTNIIDLQPTNDIYFTGFIDEKIKSLLLKKSKALVIPSKYESLSMVTLEAMQEGKIVIANGNCEVLKNHINASQSGFCYYTSNQFNEIILEITSLDEVNKIIHEKNAKKYVEDNYCWDIILKKFDDAIDLVSG